MALLEALDDLKKNLKKVAHSLKKCYINKCKRAITGIILGTDLLQPNKILGRGLELAKGAYRKWQFLK